MVFERTSTPIGSDKVVSVIVSICNGSSYDPVFRTTEQKADVDGQVIVYHMSPSEYSALIDNTSELEAIREFRQIVRDIHPSAVVFNWECCSQFSDAGFGEDPTETYRLIDYCLKRGYTLIFGDFSLKALIGTWNDEILGTCPFVKTGEMGGTFQLYFNRKQLLGCPSAQLRVVARLTDQTQVTVGCLGGTIMYTVKDMYNIDSRYGLKILSVMKQTDKTDYTKSGFNTYTVPGQLLNGYTAHTLLTYKNPQGSPGRILTSCGHWCELYSIETSIHHILDVAMEDYGEDYALKIEREYAKTDSDSERKAFNLKYAKQFIKQTPPCTITSVNQSL